MTRLALFYTTLFSWALCINMRLRAGLLLNRPGQGLMEYALILLLIAITSVGIMTVMGRTLSGVWYQRILDSFP